MYYVSNFPLHPARGGNVIQLFSGCRTYYPHHSKIDVICTSLYLYICRGPLCRGWSGGRCRFVGTPLEIEEPGSPCSWRHGRIGGQVPHFSKPVQNHVTHNPKTSSILQRAQRAVLLPILSSNYKGRSVCQTIGNQMYRLHPKFRFDLLYSESNASSYIVTQWPVCKICLLAGV